MLRTFVSFDSSTINFDTLQQIYTTNNQLQQVEQNLCIFEFDAITFTHVLMLLGQNQDRFGYNLFLYINTVVPLFNGSSISINGFIIIGQGSSEFKKRLSEDLGVAISSLLMNQSFNIRWETISQIPQNRKLSKKTPDFLGFDINDERYIYESKGTTQPQNVEIAMTKALEQSKAYPEPARGKFAIVSYFPTGDKSMPPFTFIADPPISNIFLPEKDNSILLHYTCVLSFVGLDTTLRAYETLLAEKFRLDRQDYQERVLERFPRNLGLQRFLEPLIQTFEQERLTKETITWENRTYIGRYLEVPDRRTRLFMGVHVETIEQIIRLDTNIQEIQNTRVREGEEEISIFSDGTILKLQIPDADNKLFPTKWTK